MSFACRTGSVLDVQESELETNGGTEIVPKCGVLTNSATEAMIQQGTEVRNP